MKPNYLDQLGINHLLDQLMTFLVSNLQPSGEGNRSPFNNKLSTINSKTTKNYEALKRIKAWYQIQEAQQTLEA